MTGIPGFGAATVHTDVPTLHVVSGGDGPPLLLLHGFPQTHLAWRFVAPALAEDYRVVCPDLPGYGASPALDGEDSPERFAKRRTATAMVELMSELGHDRFSLGMTAGRWWPSGPRSTIPTWWSISPYSTSSRPLTTGPH